MATNYPTQKELREVFELRVDFRNGHETLWRKNNSNNNKWKNKKGWLQVNCKANQGKGYCLVGFKGKVVYYHTVVWILTHGDIPEVLMIDHINGDTIDNQLSNLRLSTHRQNSGNRIEHREGKLSGCSFHEPANKWKAKVQIGDKHIYLGLFPTELEAHATYLKATELIDQFVDSNQFRKLLF